MGKTRTQKLFIAYFSNLSEASEQLLHLKFSKVPDCVRITVCLSDAGAAPGNKDPRSCTAARTFKDFMYGSRVCISKHETSWHLLRHLSKAYREFSEICLEISENTFPFVKIFSGNFDFSKNCMKSCLQFSGNFAG